MSSIVTYLKNHIDSLSGETFMVYGVDGKDVLEVATESTEINNWGSERYMVTLVAFNKLRRFLKTFLP
jgi:hypothetical protein